MIKLLYFFTYLSYLIPVFLAIVLGAFTAPVFGFFCLFFIIAFIILAVGLWEKIVSRITSWISSIDIYEYNIKKTSDYIENSENTPRINANLWR